MTKKETPEIEIDPSLLEEAMSAIGNKKGAPQETAEPSEETNQDNEYYDRFVRLSADFDNFRKRVLKERSDYLKYGNETLLKEMLPILDNFERALSSTPSETSQSSILQGVEMIYVQMKQLLEKFGLHSKSCIGETFNPTFHEAMTHVLDPEAAPNTVIEEHQKMYMYHEKLIRPALVTVSKANDEDAV